MIAERSSAVPTYVPSPLSLPRLPAQPLRPQPQRLRADDRPTTRPMAQRGSRVARGVRSLTWHSPMTAAVLAASFCVSLAAFYVSAYARVTSEGMEEAHLTRDIRAAKQQEEALHARISELTLGDKVQARAVQMNMEPNSTATTELLLPQSPTAAIASANLGDITVVAPGDRKIVP